jgi:hypothetical protein
MLRKTLLATALGMATFTVQAQTPSMEQMWKVIQQQQAEIKSLKAQLNKTETKLEETEVKVAATADAVEQGSGAAGGKLAKLASWAEKTTVGGYGEVLYNNGTTNSGNSSNINKELDVQRFVLFFGHEFNDELRFFSEVEYEHTRAGRSDDDAGAVELEQAYIEWDYTKNHSALAGLYLVPIGILNETHEPETFFGVERNRIESRIIPTTYRVNGIKFAGEIAPGWNYDFGVHEGLQFDDGDLDIRDARQNGARANVEDLAYTGRIKYTGIAGLEWGLTLHYQSDFTQSGISNSNLVRASLPVDDIDGLLTETHVAYQNGPFGLRALYANWDIDSDVELLIDGEGRDEQEGWYFETSWRFTESLGAFARYEFIDERAGGSTGDAEDSKEKRTLVGIN